MSGLNECELYPAYGVCSYKSFNSMFCDSSVYNLDIFGETSEREERKHAEKFITSGRKDLTQVL
ncbi:MAG: hypothetical protein IJE43_06760 [Alphaproteobacteria bacterium]|nr:hypothetical protein [Alphaproteobacteria bacterium]